MRMVLLFAGFCQENDFVIGGAQIYLNIPVAASRNKMDHIVGNRKWAASIHDVSTKRGVDHELV